MGLLKMQLIPNKARCLFGWSLLCAIALTSCNATTTDHSIPIENSSENDVPEAVEPPAAEPEETEVVAVEPAETAPNAADVEVTDATDPLTPEEIWQRLQQPEDALYVVLMRHALAPGTGDPASFRLDDCTTQRNLSDEGRSDAVQTGQAFRDRGVSVQQMLSSQWCRCLETAELMDLGEVTPFPPINSFFRDRSTADAQATDVKQYWLEQEKSGVIVMVTHQVNITGLTGIVPQSGEAVIIQVQDDALVQLGQFRPWL